jgi:hypothetical protein
MLILFDHGTPKGLMQVVAGTTQGIPPPLRFGRGGAGRPYNYADHGSPESNQEQRSRSVLLSFSEDIDCITS